jgi:hypothetical protein
LEKKFEYKDIKMSDCDCQLKKIKFDFWIVKKKEKTILKFYDINILSHWLCSSNYLNEEQKKQLFEINGKLKLNFCNLLKEFKKL